MRATVRFFPNDRYPHARATCPNCEHESIFHAEDGAIPEKETCYYCGISFWCDTAQLDAVPERAPVGMLAVRVGNDPWTCIQLDDTSNPAGWDVIDTSTD